MSGSFQNRAAWLKAKQQHPFVVDTAPVPKVGPKDILIKVHATAINPVDAGVQAMGMIYQNYPAILGEDVAGVVVEVGEAVTRFKPGDRVLACADEVDMPDFGAFQEYCVAHAALAAPLPENISFTDGAVLPLCLCTAGNALYDRNGQGLSLPYPTSNPNKIDKWILVWAASTTVGCCAIQMLKASGLRVAAVCSSHNHSLVKDLGAEKVFDFKSETVVEDIVAGLQDVTMAGVFCAYFDNDQLKKCAEISSRLHGDKKVGSVHPAPPTLPTDTAEGVEVFWSK